MLILTSPSKTMDKSIYPDFVVPTKPEFLPEAEQLHKILAKLSVKQIENLMEVSTKIATGAKNSFDAWVPAHNIKTAYPAMWFYKGDVYRPLELAKYKKAQLNYAQDSLRILSAFYGLIRPFDLIERYRLEMKRKPLGKDLNKFWRNKFTKALNADIKAKNHKFILNLASKEYYKPIDAKGLTAPVYSVEFKENKNGELKNIAIYAKHARGLMINYCIKNQVNSLEQVKKFKDERYKFKSLENNKLLFVR